MKFPVMCVGENPMEVMSRYDRNKKVEEHVKYKFSMAGVYRDAAIRTLEKMLENKDMFPSKQDEYFDIMEMRVNNLKMMSDLDYYLEMTEGMRYDEENNALTDENEDGKWVACRFLDIKKDARYPLELKDGTQSYSALNKDIDWEKTDKPQSNVMLFKRAWDMVIWGDEPKTEDDKKIYNAMSDRKDYLVGFGTRDKYVRYSTAYWTTAFVDENGWHDVNTDSKGNYEDWILKFYDRFITNLSPDSRVTILECE